VKAGVFEIVWPDQAEHVTVRGRLYRVWVATNAATGQPYCAKVADVTASRTATVTLIDEPDRDTLAARLATPGPCNHLDLDADVAEGLATEVSVARLLVVAP
jgi:hypothetical protein